MKVKLIFSECEHEGDMDHYAADIIASGGKIVNTYIDYDNEIGTAIVEIEDKEKFLEKFRETDSYGFM